MTSREQIINDKGGKCNFCDEDRVPALQITLPYKVERKTAWDKYYQIIRKHHLSSVTVVCRNCQAVQKATPTDVIKATEITVVRGSKGQQIPWLETGLVLTPDNTLYSYPGYKEVENRWGIDLGSAPYLEIVLHDNTYEVKS